MSSRATTRRPSSRSSLRRLAGEAGPLDWLIGTFYSDERINLRFSFLTGSQYAQYFAGLDNILAGGTVTPGIGNAPSAGLSPVINNLYDELASPSIGIPAGAGTAGNRDVFSQDSESIALFTHNIWALSKSTELSFGLRFTHESKKLKATYKTLFNAEPVLDAAITDATADAMLPPGTLATFSNCNTAIAPTSGTSAASIISIARSGYCLPWLRADLDAKGANQERSEDEWSGDLSLRHRFTENVSAYVSYARGYKGGGFNLGRDFSKVFTGAAPDLSFDAEFVDAHEIGFKSNWFDNDLILNLALYHNEYENFQLNTFNGIQFVVTTVPEVTVDGAELDLIWRTPLAGLTILGGVAYNDATYGDDCKPVATCRGWVQDNLNPITGELTLARLPGSSLTHSPEWTATTSLTYGRPLLNGAVLGLFYIDARYVDEQNTGSDLRPSKVQPSYTLFNSRLGISAPDERVSLELWARNLTDEDYAQTMFDAPLQLGTAGPTQGAFLGDLRTFGATLRALLTPPGEALWPQPSGCGHFLWRCSWPRSAGGDCPLCAKTHARPISRSILDRRSIAPCSGALGDPAYLAEELTPISDAPIPHGTEFYPCSRSSLPLGPVPDRARLAEGRQLAQWSGLTTHLETPSGCSVPSNALWSVTATRDFLIFPLPVTWLATTNLFAERTLATRQVQLRG